MLLVCSNTLTEVSLWIVKVEESQYMQFSEVFDKNCRAMTTSSAAFFKLKRNWWQKLVASSLLH